MNKAAHSIGIGGSSKKNGEISGQSF